MNKDANMHQNPKDSVKKAMRWVWALFLAATLVLSVALIFILTKTTNSQSFFYTPYFRWLSVINVTIAFLLLAALLWAGVRLFVRFRQGRFGSRLLIKLAAVFTLVGIFPGLLVYAVSYQFVSKSIETWFDVKVEGALSAGLNLGQVSFSAKAQDLANNTKMLAASIMQTADAKLVSLLNETRRGIEADRIVLMTDDGKVIASSGIAYGLAEDTVDFLRRTELLQTDVLYGIDDAEDGSLPEMWAMVAIRPSLYDIAGRMRILRVSATVPRVLANNAHMVEEAYREYQERALGREGLREMYIGTLTLALFLAMFCAVALAVTLGLQLLRPLLILVEGVRQVSKGDLSPKQLVHTRDELGGLTLAFAEMTSQLREANEVASKSMRQVADARTHLQAILDNLTTGVIELDQASCIQMVNPGACAVLKQDLKQGQKFNDIEALKNFSKKVEENFAALLESPQEKFWQKTFELDESLKDERITIVARGLWLGHGIKLMVIDDISDIISAQRSVAWGEVARRLAHEIKNPLTPIQLSAERIEYKFADKLEEADRAVLQRSVKVIVEQVDAMKRLVNEFREYARLPVADLKPLDLNKLVYDVAQLYIATQEQRKTLQIVMNLAENIPLIKGDASQLRQVLHNLLQNAIDAVETKEIQKVLITTKCQLPQNGVQQAGRVSLIVEDTGVGFSEKSLRRAFEPYVTTKPKGTGLGLAVVKKIIEEHGARISLGNHTDEQGTIAGAQVLLSFPIIEAVQTNKEQGSSFTN